MPSYLLLDGRRVYFSHDDLPSDPPNPEINADIDERIRRGAARGVVTFSSLNHRTAAPAHTPPSAPPKRGLLHRLFGRRRDL